MDQGTDQALLSNDRYRALIEGIREVFVLQQVVLDPAGELVDVRFLDLNPAAEQFLGISRATAIGRNRTDVLGPFDAEGLDALRRTYHERKQVRLLRLIRDRWLESLIVPVGPDQLATLAVDVTDLKRAEASAASGKRAAEEVNAQANRFLAMLGHELRNPLAAIAAAIHIVNHTSADADPSARARGVIERQVAVLTRLVDDLLNVAQLTRQRVTIERARVDLCALVRDGLRAHSATFAARGLQLEARFGTELWVDADSQRLTQVMDNLLANAAKFTPHGGSVLISAARDGDSAVLSVRDTGAGIAPDLLPQLFEPFTQAPQQLSRTQGGLGLGLAIVKGIVSLHGGVVSAKSDGVGHGSTFEVRLPLAPAPAPAMQPVNERTPITPGSHRILVIEDNADAADTLAMALQLSGHEVKVASNGPDGLATARTFRPQIVLCDIGLPEMDGYAVARAFNADRELRGVTLVALTGYALPEDRRRATEAGFALHVAKPFDLNDLEQLLSSSMSRP